MSALKCFLRYYGGKYRAAPHYPKPKYNIIVEPFAGAAGYSTRYYDCNIILVEKYPVLAEMWRYLISVKPEEVRRIPYVEHVDALPDWVPSGGRTLVGFWMNSATVSPCKQLSSGQKKMLNGGYGRPPSMAGWTDSVRERIASQVSYIKHWKILEGDYTLASNSTVPATYFIDPPYNNKAGSYYVHSSLDYAALGEWCKQRTGQVIVCENEGADWLPFQPFKNIQASPMRGKGVSREVIWTNGNS